MTIFSSVSLAREFLSQSNISWEFVCIAWSCKMLFVGQNLNTMIETKKWKRNVYNSMLFMLRLRVQSTRLVWSVTTGLFQTHVTSCSYKCSQKVHFARECFICHLFQAPELTSKSKNWIGNLTTPLTIIFLSNFYSRSVLSACFVILKKSFFSTQYGLRRL